MTHTVPPDAGHVVDGARPTDTSGAPIPVIPRGKDTSSGLSPGVFSRDLARGHRVSAACAGRQHRKAAPDHHSRLKPPHARMADAGASH